MPSESRGCSPWRVTPRAHGSRRKRVKRSARTPVANGRPMASWQSVDCSGLWDTGSTGEYHGLTGAILATINTAKEARTRAGHARSRVLNQTSAPSAGPTRPSECFLPHVFAFLRGHDYELASEYKTQPTPLWTQIDKALRRPVVGGFGKRPGGTDREQRLRDLRHFYASGLIVAGCDVVTVQRALGHHSAVVTLPTYGHLWPTAEDRTRAAAASLMASATSAEAPVRPQRARGDV